MNKLSLATRLSMVVGLAVLAGCERPVPDSVQRGYRGTGMVQVYNPRIVADLNVVNKLPPVVPAADRGGPRSRDVFQNVQVLGDTGVAEFTRLMTAMTEWVSPKEGCAYCHNEQNYAEDNLYTKIVSRRMLEMTRYINADWKAHVAETGVTCYTCHRGQPVPSEIWFKEPAQTNGAGFIGGRASQNLAATNVKLASLPSDYFTPFLLDSQNIRVGGTTSLPTGNRASIKQAEWTYSLMTHMSTALNVNCTYCHNTQSFVEWENAPPQRVTAYHGIRMSRDLNVSFLEPLQSAFPDYRLGPTGDAPKVNCATCHQGAYKPMNGAPMLKDHPELAGPSPMAPAPAEATVAAN